MTRVRIIDTTVRDGSHSVAHKFTPEQVATVARGLDEAGVWAVAVGHGDGLGAASRQYGWYCRNTAYNPFTVEGKKTVSFEICEAMGWSVPDSVFVGVGDGNILSGVAKGSVSDVSRPPALGTE